MKLQCETAVYMTWKQGQAIKTEFRNIFWACKDNTRKAKAYSKLAPLRGIKDDKNPQYKKPNSETVGPLLHGVCDSKPKHG